MKELSAIEMNDVSGAYSWSFDNPLSFLGSAASNVVEAISSATIAGSIGTIAGAMWGGRHGADGGGILGFGIISQGVGMVCGAVISGVGSAIAATVVGYDTTYKLAYEMVVGIIDGTFAQ